MTYSEHELEFTFAKNQSINQSTLNETFQKQVMDTGTDKMTKCELTISGNVGCWLSFKFQTVIFDMGVNSIDLHILHVVTLMAASTKQFHN